MPNLYNNKTSGVRELKLTDFGTDSYGRVVVNHKDFINKNGMIVFYADWCGHCKNMVNDWSTFATMMGNQFPVGAFNCGNRSKGVEALQKYAKVEAYPTIKYVSKDGRMEQYRGKHDVGTWVRFACETAKHCVKRK